MRSRNVFFNFIFSLLYMAVMIIMGFIVPRYIIAIYGSEINGLTATIMRTLSVVSLIQAGACGAAIYHMYKPVADFDYQTQSAILYSSRKYYRKVCVVYVMIVGGCSFFYAQQLQSTKIGYWDIIIAFGILACSGMLNFYYLSRYDIFLSPHQKQYLLKIGAVIGVFVQYVFLLWAVLHRWNFRWIYVSTLIGTLFTLIFNSYFFKRESCDVIVDDPIDKNYSISGRNYLMLSCVGNDIVNIVPPIIITAFCGLAQVSVFAVYSTVYTVMILLLKNLQLSISAVFGNVINTESEKKIADSFNTIVYIFTVSGAFLSSCMAFLLLPFIKLYTTGLNDIDYFQPQLSLMLAFLVAITAYKEVYCGLLCDVYGLFELICKYTITSAIVGIVISIASVYVFGMPFVVIGMISTVVFSLMMNCIFLKKNIGWLKFSKIIQRFVVLTIVPLIFFYIGNLYLEKINTAVDFLIVTVIVGSVSVLIIGFYSFFFEKKEFFCVFNKFIRVLR